MILDDRLDQITHSIQAAMVDVASNFECDCFEARLIGFAHTPRLFVENLACHHDFLGLCDALTEESSHE